LQGHNHSDRHVFATGGLGCTGSQDERTTHGEDDMEWEEAVHCCFVSFMIYKWGSILFNVVQSRERASVRSSCMAWSLAVCPLEE
jgi:hypothetical protein